MPMVKYIPNYYQILGIATDANKKTIKKAYKRLSKKYGPESNVSKKAKTYNKLINDAYIVLTDDKKRKKYDEILKKAKNDKKEKIKELDIDTKDVVKTVKDNYSTVSKLFKAGSKGMKGKSLLGGTKLLIGGAMAGYGIKKGRDYMANRGRNKE